MNTPKPFKLKIKYFEIFQKCIYAFGFESSMKSWDDAQVRKGQFIFEGETFKIDAKIIY